jgi:hypothetical protein
MRLLMLIVYNSQTASHHVAAQQTNNDAGCRWRMRSRYDKKGFEFTLRALPSAVSRIHMDSEGASSLVKVLSGIKLWAVMILDAPGTMTDWKEWASRDWDVAVLKPGDAV